MRDLYDIAMDICRVRDALEPIKTGEITRGCASTKMGDLSLEPGKRKTKLKDAKEIATQQCKKLNALANELDVKFLDKCPTCGLPMLSDEKYVRFAVGASPVHMLSLKLRAEWCSHPECKTEVVTILPTKTGRLDL